MLVLASAVILGSDSRGTYYLRFETPPNMEHKVPVFISPRNRVVQLYHQPLSSFSLPPITGRTTVEVFEPASARERRAFCFIIYRINVGRNSQVFTGEAT
jgi:hypothetical protein